MTYGTLYLIPTPLQEDAGPEWIPPATLERVFPLRHFFAEELRTARRCLRRMGFTASFDEVQFCHIGKHSDPREREGLFAALLSGNDAGLLSEAGAPAVADPGSTVVMQAHRLGIPVVPLSGPSSLLLALMASGMNGQAFSFHGYLPLDPAERQKKIRQLAEAAVADGHTRMFIETPFRNRSLLKDLLEIVPSALYLGIAYNLHGEGGWCKTLTVGEWKKQESGLDKHPAVFMLGRAL